MADPHRRRRWLRRARWIGIAVVLTFGVLMGLLYGFQRSLIYFPDNREVPAAATVIPGAEDITITTSDGLDLAAWYVPPLGSPERDLAVLMAPGNAGNRSDRAGLAELLAQRGFAALVLEYRGFGGNPGTPTEDGLHQDALAAAAALAERGFPPSRSIYLGESLGTGVVAALATARPPAGVVLRSPFTSLADVARHQIPVLPVAWVLQEEYPVKDQIAALKVPVSVIHGDADTVVPSALSATVADAAPNLVDEILLPGVGHNDSVMFGATVADTVARLADSLPAG